MDTRGFIIPKTRCSCKPPWRQDHKLSFPISNRWTIRLLWFSLKWVRSVVFYEWMFLCSPKSLFLFQVFFHSFQKSFFQFQDISTLQQQISFCVHNSSWRGGVDLNPLNQIRKFIAESIRSHECSNYIRTPLIFFSSERCSEIDTCWCDISHCISRIAYICGLTWNSNHICRNWKQVYLFKFNISKPCK